MRVRSLPWGLFPVLFSLVLDLPAFRYGISLLDEGFLLDPVMRILAGEVPYRDFYHFYAPGRFYLCALLFSIFGADLLVSRLLWVFLHAVLVYLIYRSARRLVASPGYAIVPALLFSVAPGPWFKVFFPLSTVANLLALLRLYERPSRERSFVAGLIAGGTLLLRQDVGGISVSIALGMRLFLPRSGGRGAPFRWYAFGLALLLVPVGLAFHAADALVPMVDQLLFAGFRGTSANALPMPPLWPRLSAGGGWVEVAGSFLHRLPPLVYLLTAGWLLWRRWRGRGGNGALTLTMLFGVLTYQQDLRRSDIPHLLQCITPAWLLLVAWLEALYGKPTGRSGRWASRIRTLVGVGVTAGALLLLCRIDAFDLPHSILSIRGKGYPLDLPRGRVILRRERGEVIEGVIAEIARLPEGVPIVALPDIPLVYFLAGRTNPLFFELFRPGHLDEAQELRTIERIEAIAPRLIVYDQQHLTDGREENRFEHRFPHLYRYILRNYRLARQIGSFSLLVPRGKGATPWDS
ncbi:MAG: hypothetical protein D6795_19555 [Deltaproteobacteria bacterium]|nr:MAG: hypothetical protein D6795_19555 [Deltaproteobacteria bacterium]